jgi:hypothetical protein
MRDVDFQGEERRKMRGLFTCFGSFLISVPITSETDPRPNGEEPGLDHPGVAIDVPELKCKCKDSDHGTTSSVREYGGDERSIQTHPEKKTKYIGLLVWFQALYTKFILSCPLSGLVKLHTIG